MGEKLKKLNSKEISKKLKGKSVEFSGWVAEKRDFGNLKFLSLRDSFGFTQVTAHKQKVPEQVLKAIENLTKESIVRVEGIVQVSEKAPNGAEIIPKKIEIISKSFAPVPLDISGKIESDLSSRFDWRSIDLRMLQNQAVFRIQSKLLEGAQEYLEKNSYIQLFTPCLMGSISEGGAEVFKMKYFETEAFLRQDPQLHRQLAIAGGFEKIADIGPSWRAEESFTSRHLCEHRGWALEKAFIKDETETERIEEELIIAMLKKVKKDCVEELKELKIELRIPKTPFPELRFPKIYEILEKEGKKIEEHLDLDTEAEKILWNFVQKKFKSEFYFVNRFPFSHKPFYVMRVDENPSYARSVDLYFKGVEMSSGGQREHRYEKLMQNVREKGLNEKNIEWFTKFFKYGVPPHGGFNLGVERLTMQLLNLKNIREATLFPRDPKRLLP